MADITTHVVGEQAAGGAEQSVPSADRLFAVECETSCMGEYAAGEAGDEYGGENPSEDDEGSAETDPGVAAGAVSLGLQVPFLPEADDGQQDVRAVDPCVEAGVGVAAGLTRRGERVVGDRDG